MCEKSAVFQVDFSDGADVIGGDVFVLDGDFQNGGVPGTFWDTDIDGLVPDDGSLFFSFDDFGSVFLRLATGVKFKDDVVLHVADNIVAFLEES